MRRIVEEEKLEPEKIRGTGEGGRLTKGDVLAAAQQRSKADLSAVTSAKAEEKVEAREVEPSGDGRFTRKKMSPLRRKIAQQLVMAQHTAAILTTFNECDMSAVQELRRNKQDEFTKKNGVKLGFMSFFVKACVEALKAVPVVNGHIEDDDFIQNNFYDIGVAVGTERGLVVPVVRDADKKSFAGLERNIADYASRARDGKLKIEDLQGGTFTISNGGVYGSLFAHTDSKSAAKRNPRHAQNHAATSRGGRQSGSSPDDVSRPQLRSPRNRRKRSRHLSVKVKDCIEDPKKLPLDF